MKLVAVVLMFVAAATASGASKEPFASFHYFDQQLSILDRRATELKTDATGKARAETLRAMQVALRRIRQHCATLKRLYRGRGQRYGVKMFTELDRDAAAEERALTAVRQHRAGADQKLEKARLALVLRYQSLSSNYGANQCEARQWACCEPRRDPETNQVNGQGCRWMCVSKPRACSGFLGPRTIK